MDAIGPGDRVVVIRDGEWEPLRQGVNRPSLVGRRGTVIELTPSTFARYMVKLDFHHQELAFEVGELEKLSILDVIAEASCE